MKNFLFLALSLFTIAVQAQNKLSFDHYFDFETVSNPQLSPDGRQVLYTRTWTDAVNDKRPNDLWIVNADGSQNRYFLEGSNGRWSPDGTRVAFLKEGKPSGVQIFVKYLGAEGEPTQVTRLEKAPSGITWSPDGKQLAFTMFVEDKKSWNIKLPKKPEGAKWTMEPRFVDKLQYRRDRQGFVEQGNNHLFVVPAEGGTERQLTSGSWDHDGFFSWTQDGKKIIFSGLRIPEAEYANRESNLYTVEVANGTIAQLTERKGTDSYPVVSPDNKMIAFIGGEWTENFYLKSQLYVMNLDGSNVRAVSTDLDRIPTDLHWAADNSGVYFTAEDQGAINLFFSLTKGGTKAITKGAQTLSVDDIGKNGVAVGVRSTQSAPPDVVRFSLTNPVDMKQLTAVNQDLLSNIKLGEAEEIWYNSAGGMKVQGWIIRPPDFDAKKKYPLILQIHGGPHAMYNVAFNFNRQLHASEGYVVLYTNPRGSTGYGYDFANAIQNAYPSKDYDDLMNGVDAVIAKGYIDEKRLYVYGGSGGGVLTSWIIGHNNRFAGAGVLCPVIDWLSFVGTTDGAGWYRNFKKLPWEDPSEHIARSPLMYAGNVKTPTLLMTGVLDLRTPISQTEEYYMALKMQKVPTVMVRFNEEYHGTTTKPSNFLRTVAYLHYWFNQYGGTPEKPAETTASQKE
jgi:dipeptidyl aminopeptidase/acylaminoacyl peptidase